MESAPGARTLINGRWRDYFSGTGYLGLQGHPGLIAAATEALQNYGLTSGTSRGGYGEHPVFHSVERTGAAFLGEERSLYTVSAYLGSGILLPGLRGEYEKVYLDESAHFSVREAAAASGVPLHPYHHCDPASLEETLRRTLAPGERPLILTDGVFPISGEIAPLGHYLTALAQFPGSILCIDDAHATGVIGTQGRGALEFLGAGCRGGVTPPVLTPAATTSAAPQPAPIAASVPPPAAVRCYTAHTLSKAMGAHGGLIAGSAGFIEQLWRNAPALAGSSPAPIPAAAAAVWALDYVAGHPELREKLWANVRKAREGFRKLGWELADTPVPIVCLPWRPGLDLASIQAELFARDLCVAHITRYSSTPAGGALRVAIFASHGEEQIERLLAEMEKLI
jgi:glycine C-acetyltransferase/8-amino-7-oxononanoate synthase